MAFLTPLEIFGLLFFTSGPGWRVWRPDDEPLSLNKDDPGCRPGTLPGALSGLNLSYPGESPLTVPMCLFRSRNMISDSIHATGRWHDCGALVAAWRSLRPSPRSLMLEVGGNIGACSMEVLLRTDARLIIFEPSFTNLYYLTRTLQAAHRHSPHLDLAHRVVVFPIGLGNESSSTELFADTANSGDSIVVGRGEPSATSTASRRHTYRSQGFVTIHPLDELMPPEADPHASTTPPGSSTAVHDRVPVHVPLMKIDVQGYECRALQGMHRLLTSRALGAIFTEVSLPHLARAGCSQQGLLDLLNRHDYQVKNPNGPRGHWSWDILARLISDNTQGGSRVPSAGV